MNFESVFLQMFIIGLFMTIVFLVNKHFFIEKVYWAIISLFIFLISTLVAVDVIVYVLRNISYGLGLGFIIFADDEKADRRRRHKK
jgi:hypothetical protein